MRLIKQNIKLPIVEVKFGGSYGGDDDDNFRRHGKLMPRNIRAIFCGPSNTGKTTALLSLIYNTEGVKFNNLYIFSKTLYQRKYKELAAVMRSLPEIGYYTFSDCESVPSPDEVKPNSLMIFDDVATELGKNKHLRAYFSMGRHKNIDTFLCLQTYSSAPKQLCRDNANMILLFKQDGLNLKHVWNDHIIGDMSFEKFCQLCHLAWNREEYGCLVICKDFDLNNGRYRIGFDTYINLDK